MQGSLHIFTRTDQPDYQVNFTSDTGTYSHTYQGPKLDQLLRFSLGLDDFELERLWRGVHDDGAFTLTGVEMTPEQLAAANMERAPVDS